MHSEQYLPRGLIPVPHTVAGQNLRNSPYNGTFRACVTGGPDSEWFKFF